MGFNHTALFTFNALKPLIDSLVGSILCCSRNHAAFFVVIPDQLLVCDLTHLGVPEVNFVALAHREARSARQELIIDVGRGDFERLIELALRPFDLRAHLALPNLQLVDLSDVLINISEVDRFSCFRSCASLFEMI